MQVAEGTFDVKGTLSQQTANIEADRALCSFSKEKTLPPSGRAWHNTFRLKAWLIWTQSIPRTWLTTALKIKAEKFRDGSLQVNVVGTARQLSELLLEADNELLQALARFSVCSREQMVVFIGNMQCWNINKKFIGASSEVWKLLDGCTGQEAELGKLWGVTVLGSETLGDVVTLLSHQKGIEVCFGIILITEFGVGYSTVSSSGYKPRCWGVLMRVHFRAMSDPHEDTLMHLLNFFVGSLHHSPITTTPMHISYVHVCQPSQNSFNHMH